MHPCLRKAKQSRSYLKNKYENMERACLYLLSAHFRSHTCFIVTVSIQTQSYRIINCILPASVTFSYQATTKDKSLHMIEA